MENTSLRTVSKISDIKNGQKFSLYPGGEQFTFLGVEVHGAPANHGAILREGHVDDLGFLPTWIRVVV